MGPFYGWLSLSFCLYIYKQKYSRLRCLLCVKGLVICFYLGWSGSILQFRQNIIKVGSKSWLLTCSSNITLSQPSYTGSALKREPTFCNGYPGLLYFWSLELIAYQCVCRCKKCAKSCKNMYKRCAYCILNEKKNMLGTWKKGFHGNCENKKIYHINQKLTKLFLQINNKDSCSKIVQVE